MVDLSTTILAAEEGGGGNFLIPNGTFFFVLLIFLIVLGVITKFVVPPISKVLNDREAMVTKTAEDNRKSTELFAAAQADSRKVMGSARREAAAIRDKARGDGRQIVEDHRSRAAAESAATLQAANDELSKQGRQTAEELETSIETLSTTLASRVLGIDIGSPTNTGQGR